VISVRPQKNLLEDESRFYGGYSWSLNPLLTVQEAIDHLREELRRLDSFPPGWRRDEVMTNIFLLGGMIVAAVEDYIGGTRYTFSKVEKLFPTFGPLVKTAGKLQGGWDKFRIWRLRRLVQWRAEWQITLVNCLMGLPGIGSAEPGTARSLEKLASLISPLPEELLKQRPRIPGAFRSKDLTHYDVIRLGEKFETEFPDRNRPLLITGLRTAGSFFATVLCSFLKAKGYKQIRCVTLRPKRTIARWETQALAVGKEESALVLVIDEHPNTGFTLAKTADLLVSAGFDHLNIVYLFPVHPAHPNWREVLASRGVSNIRVVHLEADEWHKYRLLQSETVDTQLNDYFQASGFRRARLQLGTRSQQENAVLSDRSDEKVHARLKRVYEVRLEKPLGGIETRFILAKSVGWGWLGYHAFLAGDRLIPFVPTILGLRDGILYQEWIPQCSASVAPAPESSLVQTAASYIAARVRHLPLGVDPTLEFSRQNNHQGNSLLAGLLSRVYGRGAALKYPRLLHRVSATHCPFPTLIDGRLNQTEWVRFSSSFVKTDFEHHGMGKTELNITDPAYDVASAILHLNLSSTEERQFLDQYEKESGDTGVEGRLFLNKLIAGTWELSRTLDKLLDPDMTSRHDEFNQRYIRAWNFLTLHTARFCGRQCRKPITCELRSPVVFLDIDGVLDNKVFRFPSTTAAGIRGISLLHAHGVTVIVNTARSLSEVKEYCEAYGLSGGIAEYGSVLWNAAASREKILTNDESLAHLDAIRQALRDIPGIFIDDTYCCMVRAYIYEEKGTVPVPKTLIDTLLATHRLDRLAFHQTNVDTAIFAKGTTKGTGLRAFLDWVGNADWITAAVGDSETDLPMFSEVTQCYAPSQIWCKRDAERLGCHIARHPYQRGFLSVAGTLTHPSGGECERCASGQLPWVKGRDPFLDMLEVPDQSPIRRWLDILFDPLLLRAFRE